jgi:hypothetical protein
MRISNGMLIFLASFAMLIALMAQVITVAGSYWPAFMISIGALVASFGCCFVAIRRGGSTRSLAILIAIPGLLVITDWLCRITVLLRI